MGSRAIPIPDTMEAARAWAEAQALLKPPDDNIRWALETLDRILVGTVQTHRCQLQHGHFEYGIVIAREHWGHGFAADALRIVLRFMFLERRYQKVTARVFAFNDQSQRFHEKFGFVLEGRLRRMHFTGGIHHDTLLYGMTREEFLERYP